MVYLSIQASTTVSKTQNATDGMSSTSTTPLQISSPPTSASPPSPAEAADVTSRIERVPAPYEESDAALAALLLCVGVETRAQARGKRPIDDVQGVNDVVLARPSKKTATRSVRANLQRSSPRSSKKKAETIPPQAGPSRISRVSDTGTTTSTSVPRGAKPSIREGFTINADGAMENDDAIELPPLAGVCQYKLTKEDGTFAVCNETFEGGFNEKQKIRDHFSAHVSELVKLRGTSRSGIVKCFQCDKVQGLPTMVRHIETTHFGVQRWDCKHCDNLTTKTRMDKNTIQRHLAGCLSKKKATNSNTQEEKEKKAKKNSGRKN